ncbi:MAG: hypothetical protein LBQ48_05690, partial [Oscillospiraceae bacterium]|nr:hypothetical protein [Oscillospiraceae bacterium]
MLCNKPQTGGAVRAACRAIQAIPAGGQTANAPYSYNDKLAEIWQLITQSPDTFKGGGIWTMIVNIHDAVDDCGF